MADTKENILLAALRLFAKDGYEAVSVSMIAAELGMAKSALYKHYKNKRDIFDCLVERMNKMDFERARVYEVPEGTFEEMAEVYRKTQLEKVKEFSKAQFRYWTEDNFSACFRKMLTLEQYRNPEMGQLYSQYLVVGPIGYIRDLFYGMVNDKETAEKLAMEFYAPMFFLYSVYDGAENKEEAAVMLEKHLNSFTEKEIGIIEEREENFNEIYIK